MSDIEAARAELAYGSFVTFSDPDGNGWILQEVTTRFPGRLSGDTTYDWYAEYMVREQAGQELPV